MSRRIVFLSIMLLLIGGIAMAQSPIKVNGVSLSPTSFAAGDAVAITVNLENAGTTSYGCVGGAFFKLWVPIYKAASFTTANQIWSGEAALTSPMAPGEKRSITLSTTWTVPNLDVPAFHFQAWGPVCAPDEFGNTATLKVNRSCVYKYQPIFQWVKKPIRELSLIRRR